MTCWIKICGLTTPEAVDAALAERVDAIGFVFASSSRQLTVSAAARLAARARGRVMLTAVMRQPTQESVDEVLGILRPDLLQTDADDLPRLRLPRELQLLPVFRRRPDHERLPSRLLFEGPASGSGAVADWASARELALRVQLVLAGGLNAANVAAAIAAVRPFGVDVSSGVEERPGIKSPVEIARFVSAARSAAGLTVSGPVPA